MSLEDCCRRTIEDYKLLCLDFDLDSDFPWDAISYLIITTVIDLPEVVVFTTDSSLACESVQVVGTGSSLHGVNLERIVEIANDGLIYVRDRCLV